MAGKKEVPMYGTVMINGNEYYRTKVRDADGKYFVVYGKTREEVFLKVKEAKKIIRKAVYRNNSPTVEDYSKKWMLLHSSRVEESTMVGYRHIVNKYIIRTVGHKTLRETTTDDLKGALLTADDKSSAIYRTIVTLMKMIFESAVDSGLLDRNPAAKLSVKGGIEPKEKQALTDSQVERLIETVRGLPPYLFVMIGLYTGLRREEILGLKWDSVYLDTDSPYLTVRRAWRAIYNQPEISERLKTKAARRNVPIPKRLYDCLVEARARAKSDFVICNRDGEPLTYTQFQRVWAYIHTRTAGVVKYKRYTGNGIVEKTFERKLGEYAAHNGRVKYTLDFRVTPHQLRHTYITNLIYAGVDPKTVQYLAGHKNSKITMDIYAKAKYNRPEELSGLVNAAFEKMKKEGMDQRDR